MVVIPERSKQRWQLDAWDAGIGNKNLKRALNDMVAGVRMRGDVDGYTIFAYGESRGGKTAFIQYAVKCLLCCDLRMETLDACHECANCRNNNELYGNVGWESFVDPQGESAAAGLHSFRFEYIPIDCARLTEGELEEVLLKLRYDTDTLRIIYLDEFHRLARRSMDERLLKAMESYKAIWLASSAVVGELDQMVQNRFDELIAVQRPSVKELAAFLAARCEEWDVKCDSAQQTLTRLAQRSNQVPGMALHVLRRAYRSPDRRLTRKMVDEHVFRIDESV